MVMTDPIADLLTRLRNANVVKHEIVELPSSTIKKAVANILLQEGYVKNLEEYLNQDLEFTAKRKKFLKYWTDLELL